ncbi:MAG TPA: NAD-dependent epimerase/dehydratase family protein [Bacteroidales bacterium]|nr:NAD-dependent epimerase/dehydratase family protein [Bacteroidales bacterium]HOU98319.1 NAD-dependent epimerase/dehydratase family protein [Bacteroidales bacterium]
MLNRMIAVTGSTGFVGSHLLVSLLKKDLPVLAFKRETSDIAYTQKVFELQGCAHLFNKIKWVNCHLSNYSDVVEAFNDVDIVFHAAAQVELNGKSSKQMIKKNIKITENVVNASLLQHVKRFCYVSSIATITNNINGLGKENSPFEILTTDHPYTVSKCLAELEVWRGIEEGLPAVILNPSVILGYSRKWHIFTSLVKQLQKGQFYYPMGSSSFVDIDDVVHLMMHMTLNTSITNQRFILTSENVTYEEFYKITCDVLGISGNFKPIRAKKLMMLGYIGDILSFFTKDEALLSLHTAKTLNKELKYSNEKIVDTMQYTFLPLKYSIEKMLNYHKAIQH